ncbi:MULTISPECIES: TetR/AcrR family transcriptional regulator [Actinomycetes]|uniref:TetR/AcrR family transcriptional regulator n=1 Tax=Actinomycetes TaxID=1760 RepID=UPI0001B5764D|nr:TetR/AcrR family transcriptional regulator [Amycolatopsis sp. AA4]EFL12083.1 TetR-family transcriptional regulator [Streptomyces sp. AA4]
MSGLRERKRHRTRETIASAALRLFREAGFDGVSVADIAAAAEISKPTLFAYFPTKEDLVIHQFVDDNGPAEVVRARADGVSALSALERSFLDRLAERDPLTGLNDSPDTITCHTLLYSTPALLARLATYRLEKEQDLVDELQSSCGIEDEFTARLAAAQIFGAQRILGFHNAREIRGGRSADETYPDAVARAKSAYRMLREGLSSLR